MRDSPICLEWRAFALCLLRAAAAALAFCFQVYGLDGRHLPSDYVFERWGEEQGFGWGAVHSVAQTPDGYLWVGCEAGLVRFDGVSFRLISGPDGSGVPTGPVQKLITDSDGNLWILGRNMSLYRLRHGTAQNMVRALAKGEKGATALGTSSQGEAIFWTGSEAIWCCQGDVVQSSYRASTLRHNLLVIALAETGSHKLWVGSRDAGLLSLENGKLVDYAGGIPDLKVNAILPDSGGGLWVGTDGGAIRWNGSMLTEAGVPNALLHAQITALARDREANIWVATGQALFRVTQDGNAEAVQTDRIAGVNVLFEDREGNLWLGTDEGLARLRDGLFLSYPIADKSRPRREASPVYIDPQRRIWYAVSGGTLGWRRGFESGEVRVGGPDDTIYALAGQSSDIWVGSKFGGLTLVHCREDCRVQRRYTEAYGLPDNAVTSVFVAEDAGVWAGTANGRATRLEGRQSVAFGINTKLSATAIRAISQTQDETVWFATAEGLSAEHKGVWRNYSAADGLPPGGVNCIVADGEGVLWIGTSYGLAFFKAGSVHLVQSAGLNEQVSGLAAERHGSVWIATPTQILEIKRAAALAGQLGPGDTRGFGTADGLLTGPVVGRTVKMAEDSSGRIWISTNRGLSAIDPARLGEQSVPALPHIQGVVADGAVLRLSERVEIPALRRRVAFDFVGLSLTAPQRVQYKYRLDAFDQDWSRPASSREAVYTNLPPGQYRFRVRASNSAGIWSTKEDSVLVFVRPAVWQTWWFKALAVLAVGLGFAIVFRARVRKVRQAMNVRFEERLHERTRIAQELHDTLLQGFLSASMQLHVAENRLEDNSAAKAPLQRATELMRKAGDEGRAALRQLRSEEDTSSLEDAFSAIPHEAMMSDAVTFRLRVEGRNRRIRAALRDDIYRISREAIVNAIRHASASNIEVKVCYDPHQLRVTVQDDGCGIDEQVMLSGREGHWGIRGMRERTERIKGKLSLQSKPGAGTEVVFRIAGNLAYQSEGQSKKRQFFGKLLS